jgi:hypothetical protein
MHVTLPHKPIALLPQVIVADLLEKLVRQIRSRLSVHFGGSRCRPGRSSGTAFAAVVPANVLILLGE